MLVNRDDEIEAVHDSLSSDGIALVTGEIGIGKTALLRGATGGRCPYAGGGLRLLRGRPLHTLERALRQSLADVARPADVVRSTVGREVLVIDDLQWVDETSLEVLAELRGEVPMLLASRGEVGGGPAVTLAGGPIPTFELAPLDDEAARALAKNLVPGRPAGEIDARVRICGGRPGPLTELLTSGVLSPDTRMDLEGWLTRLAPELQEALLLMSLAGRPLPEGVLDPSTVVDLERLRLVNRRNSALVEASYPLAGDLLRERLDDTRRRSLHLVIGTATDVPPALAATHLLAAGDPQGAAGAAREAVVEAVDPTGRADAFALLVEALGDACPDPDRVAAAEALLSAGRPDEVPAVTGPVADPTCALRSAVVTARALRQLGEPLAAQMALDGVAGLDGTAERAVAAERATVALWPGWDPSPARELADAGAPETAVQVVARHLVGGSDWGAIAVDLEGIPRPGDAAGELDLQLATLGASFLASDLDRAIGLLDTMTRRSAEIGEGRWSLATEGARAVASLHLDATCGATADSLEPIVSVPVVGDLRFLFAAHLAVALADLGRNADAVAVLDRLEPTGSAADDALRIWAMVEVQFSAGRPGRLRQALDAARRLPADLPTQALVAVTSAWAAFESGETVPAPVSPTPDAFGAAVLEMGAVASLADGDTDGAAEAFRLASQAWEPTHRRGAMRCRWAEGEALRRGGGIAEARVILTEVDTQATELGMLPLASRARQSLRRAGVNLRQRSAATEDGLSAREREVVLLVGDGMSAAAIAQQLGVATSTVETQIASAMRRLGARTRLQAVALLRARDTKAQT